MNTKHPSPFRSQRGSALLVTIIVASMILTMAGLMIPLSLRSFESAKQNHYQTNAFFLAESGVEEGIYALQNFISEEEWKTEGWSSSPDNMRWMKSFTFDSLTFGTNGSQTGGFDVFLDKAVNPTTGLPNNQIEICSRGRLTAVDGSNVEGERTIMVKIERQSPFGQDDFSGRLYVSLSGQPTFDSWWSSEFPFIYSPINATKEAHVGSPSKEAGSVNLSNGTVNGNVLSGASDPLGDGAVVKKPNADITGTVVANYERNYPEIDAPSTYGYKTSF